MNRDRFLWTDYAWRANAIKFENHFELIQPFAPSLKNRFIMQRQSEALRREQHSAMPKSSDSLQHKQTDDGSENQTAGKGLAELPFCIVLTQGYTRKSKVSCYTRRIVIKL
ncbi:hypothetical protein RRG08_034207 [Elysia crispata]|uniref:Uncharacterized protein n=1 Tax=Elysia crispata TaxID=231223 RepID=A0AAE1A069_9GAST|nr:hypothetical protein RRG08_034207 [Elysia crispata]